MKLFGFYLALITVVSCSNPKKITQTSTHLNLSPDTTFYYYVNKKLSGYHVATDSGNTLYNFYDLKGNHTFTLTEIADSVSLSFHKNGGLNQILVKNNQFYQNQHYLCIINFNGTNEPTWLELKNQNGKQPNPLPFYWDKKTMQWKQQEVVDCMPVPTD